jgi:hypothetical protein
MKDERNKKNELNSQEDTSLIELAKTASSKAIRSSIAMGITIKVIHDHTIIAINPDKTRSIIRKIHKRPKLDTTSLKKGMVLSKKG